MPDSGRRALASFEPHHGKEPTGKQFVRKPTRTGGRHLESPPVGTLDATGPPQRSPSINQAPVSPRWARWSARRAMSAAGTAIVRRDASDFGSPATMTPPGPLVSCSATSSVERRKSARAPHPQAGALASSQPTDGTEIGHRAARAHGIGEGGQLVGVTTWRVVLPTPGRRMPRHGERAMSSAAMAALRMARSVSYWRRTVLGR